MSIFLVESAMSITPMTKSTISDWSVRKSAVSRIITSKAQGGVMTIVGDGGGSVTSVVTDDGSNSVSV